MVRQNEQSYCAIEHLAKSLYLDRWRDVEFAMLTVYGDGSGSELDQVVQIVAGFMASVDNWIEFARSWKEFLQRREIPYLHMKEFAHDKGPFVKFNGRQGLKDAILDDALQEIERSGAWSFVQVVDSVGFNEFATDNRAEATSFRNAYLLAATGFVSGVTGWCDENNLNLPVEYIFEAGDPKQGMLKAVMKGFRLPEPIFRSKADPEDPRRSLLPLQASDFLAYEILQGQRGDTQRRWYQQFKAKRTRWRTYSKDSMDGMMAVKDAVQRIEAIIVAEQASP